MNQSAAKAKDERTPRALCPTCRRRRRLPRLYLCRWCFGELPLHTRIALDLLDERRRARFLVLVRQIRLGVPLGEIEVRR